MASGGKREGSGRKKKDPTTIIRIPNAKKNVIQQWIKQGCIETQRKTNKEIKAIKDIKDIREILNNALKLKANAGGKIKTEIKLAIVGLDDIL